MLYVCVSDVNAIQECERLRSVLIEGPSQVRLGEVAVVEPPEGYLLLSPLRVGICGTDLELFEGSMIFLRNGMAQYPLIPGHEWVARVTQVGPGVEGFAVGDRVVGEVSIGCGDCAYCNAGSYHRCPSRAETGFMGMPGALQERMLFPATSAHLVPEGVSTEDAALTEPLAIALQAVLRAEVTAGEHVLVVGAGTIGMLVAMVLLGEFGCRVSVLSDKVERTELAKGLGCSAHVPGALYQRVIEAAGSRSAVADALAALAPGGRLVVTGLSGEDSVPVPMDNVVIADQEIRGSLGSPGIWPRVLEILGQQKIHPSDLVTHVFGLSKFDEAIALARRGDAGTGKIMIQVNEGEADE
jgi:L-iditol 2-dehydrogenase